MKTLHITLDPNKFFPYKTYRIICIGDSFDKSQYKEIKSLLNTYFILNATSRDYLLLGSKIIDCNEVILPYKSNSKNKTLTISKEVLSEFPTTPIGFVPQGNTSTEQVKCLAEWMNFWSNRAQPLIIYAKPVNLKLLKAIQKYNLPIHLLEIPNIKYLITKMLRKYQIRGISSSIAYHLGSQNILLSLNSKITEKSTLPSNHLVVLNEAILKHIIKTGETKLSEYLVRKTSSLWLEYWTKGFCEIKTNMEACEMPKGRYEIFDGFIRPLKETETTLHQEVTL